MMNGMEMDINKKDIKKKNNTVNNEEDSFVIPNEAACSPEFAEGCIIMEDEEEKQSEEK